MLDFERSETRPSGRRRISGVLAEPPAQAGWRERKKKQEARSVARRDRDLRKDSKMPKMKTKSAAKKRFKITGTGKVLAAAAGKRHGMIKRSNKFIRDARGTMVLFKADGEKVVKNFLPNGGGI
jgi:large subunit ribosomal protein L35